MLPLASWSLLDSVSLPECVQQITEDVIHTSVTAGSLCPLPALRTPEQLADHCVSDNSPQAKLSFWPEWGDPGQAHDAIQTRWT